MLVARVGGDRIDAAAAQQRPDYRCPQCQGVVILKKGRKVIAHFAHKPPTDCTWATGETGAHLEAKFLVAQALNARNVKTQIECIVTTLPGDRRAFVMAWSPKGRQIAFELQHTAIGLDEIEHRAFSYANAGVAQIWIPFLKDSVWKEGEPRDGGWFVQRYSPRPFERWVHGFNGKNGMWMYDPTRKLFWRGRLEGHQIYVEETSWYSEGGDENYGGGFHRWSKRYKQLTLTGPYQADELRITLESRRAFATKDYNWPNGRIAHLTPV